MSSQRHLQGGAAIVLIGLFFVFLAPSALAADTWWDTDWKYSKEITFNLSNTSGIGRTEIMHFNFTLEPNTTFNCSKELRMTVRGGWCDQNSTCKATLDDWKRKRTDWVLRADKNNDQYWRYYITNSEPANWKSSGLDDSGWNLGKTPIGDHNGYRTPWDGDNSYILVRNSTVLNISNISDVVSAELRVSADDDASCWLNEERIFIFGTNEEDRHWNDFYNIRPRLNLTGKNTLACRIYNSGGSQYFDAEVEVVVKEWQNTTPLAYDPDALETEIPLKVKEEKYQNGYCTAANLSAEIEIYEELGPNLAFNKTTYCSAKYSNSYNCSNIVDDSYVDDNINGLNDFWLLPNGVTGWARVDLGNNITINRIRWLNTHNRDSYDRGAKDWNVKTSQQNNSGYVNIQNGYAYQKDSYPWTEVAFLPRKAQYVQFDVNSYHSSGGGLNELQVYSANLSTRNYRVYYGNWDTKRSDMRFESFVASTRNTGTGDIYYIEDYGNGTFGEAVYVDKANSNSRGIGIGDFDNDGDLDIVAGDNSCRLYVFVNNGDESYFDKVYIGTMSCNGGINDIAVGDFNGDRLVDFVTSSQHRDYIRYWENHGNLVFTINNMPNMEYWNSWVNICGRTDRWYSYPRGKGTADVDNDGDLDVIMMEFNREDNSVYRCLRFFVYRNDGTGSFSRVRISSIGDYNPGNYMDAYNLMAGDFDNDGNADFIFSRGDNGGGGGDDGILYLHNGYGNETFNSSRLEITRVGELNGGYPYDFDNDNKLDLIISNYTSDKPYGTIYHYKGKGNWLFENPAKNITNVSWSLGMSAPHFISSDNDIEEGDDERLVIEGIAEALPDGRIRMNYSGEEWYVPANWEWGWNQTNQNVAGREYSKHKKIIYNSSYNFTGQPHFNIIGWVVNGSARWNGVNFIGNLSDENTEEYKYDDGLYTNGSYVRTYNMLVSDKQNQNLNITLITVIGGGGKGNGITCPQYQGSFMRIRINENDFCGGISTPSCNGEISLDESFVNNGNNDIKIQQYVGECNSHEAFNQVRLENPRAFIGLSPIFLNDTTILSKGNDTLWDSSMPEGVPIEKSILSRRQDFSENTTVNGTAYSLEIINITNNASAYSLPAKFTDVVVEESCKQGWTCSGFTKAIEYGESASWSKGTTGTGADASVISTSNLRREGSYALNFTYNPSNSGDTSARFYKNNAGLGNYTYLSNGSSGLWLFANNVSTFDNIWIGIGNDYTNKYQWKITSNELSNGWNYIKLNLSDPTSGSADWGDIDYLEVLVDGTTYGTDFIEIDDWRMWDKGLKTVVITSLQSDQSALEYGTANQSKVIMTVPGGEADWTQDTGKDSLASGLVFIKANIKANNTDTIKYENVTFPDSMTDQYRTDWSCSQLGRQIPSINGGTEWSSSDYPTRCSKGSVVTAYAGSDWKEDSLLESVAGGLAFVEGKVNLNNTDTIAYTGIVVNSSSYTSGLDRSGWSCYVDDGRAINVSVSASSTAQTSNYPIRCSKSGVINATGSGSWRQDASQTTEAGGTAYIEGKLTVSNSDTIAYATVIVNSTAWDPSFSRSLWSCSFNDAKADTVSVGASSSASTSTYPVDCYKNNIVGKSETSWTQLSGTTSEQILKKDVIVDNDDQEITFTNIFWQTTGYGGCWNQTASTLNGTVSSLAPGNSNTSTAYLKGDCISESLGSWEQDTSPTSKLSNQWIKQDNNLTNNANQGLNINYDNSDFGTEPSGASCYSTSGSVYIPSSESRDVAKKCNGDFLSESNGGVQQSTSPQSREDKQYLKEAITITNSVAFGFAGLIIDNNDWSSFPAQFSTCNVDSPVNVAGSGTGYANKTCEGDAISETWNGTSVPVSELWVNTPLNPVTTLTLNTSYSIDNDVGEVWSNVLLNVSNDIAGATGITTFGLSASEQDKTVWADYTVDAPLASPLYETYGIDYYEKNLTVTCNDACDQMSSVKINISVNDSISNYTLYHWESGDWAERTGDYSFIEGDGWTSWTIPSLSTHDYKVNASSGGGGGGGGWIKTEVIGENTSSPGIGDAVKLYVLWNSSANLSTAVLSTNESGTWENKTAYGSPLDLGDSTYVWSNFTWQNSSIAASTIVEWKVYVNDSMDAWTGSSSMIFTVGDNIPPSITVGSPGNSTYNELWVWANASLNEPGGWCGVSLDGAGNQTMSGSGMSWYKNISVAEGAHNVKLSCNDTSGNMGESSIVYFNISILPAPPAVPVLAVQLPENKSYNYNQSIALNYTQTNATWCGYSLDGAANITLSGCSNTSFDAAEGSHQITVYGNNTGGEVSDTVFFSVDMTAPTVYLESPVNGTTYTTDSIGLSYVVSESSSWCGYSLNSGSNSTVTGNTTLTLSNAGYNLTLYCNDTAGNMGYNGTVFFTVNKQDDGGDDGGGGGGGAPPASTSKPGLEVSVSPTTIEIEKGSYKSVTLSVKNNGTLDLDDIEIKVSGVSASWVSPVNKFNLTEGESKSITITFTPDVTGEFTASIKAEHPKISESVSLIIKVTGEEVQQQQENVTEAQVNETAGGLDLSGITGMFTAVTPEAAIAGVMLIVLIVVGFAFFKMMKKY